MASQDRGGLPFVDVPENVAVALLAIGFAQEKRTARSARLKLAEVTWTLAGFHPVAGDAHTRRSRDTSAVKAARVRSALGERVSYMSRPLCQLLLIVALIAAFVLASGAYAVQLPVGSSSADDFLLNFDFTGSSPPPPFTTTRITSTFSGYEGQTITIDVFDGLNGAGRMVTSVPVTSLNPLDQTFSFVLIGTGFPDSDTFDGVFSVGFRSNAGNVNLVSLTATEIHPNGVFLTIIKIPPQNPMTAIPVPVWPWLSLTMAIVLFTSGALRLRCVLIRHRCVIGPPITLFRLTDNGTDMLKKANAAERKRRT